MLNRRRRTRTGSRALALLAMLAAAASLAGCAADPGRPESAASPPTLPDPARLVPDLAFFDQGGALAAKAAAAKANFLNAYLRVVVVDALAQLVLAPPVAAFAVALHTVPSPQPDGSWLWVYTHVSGAEEAQIRLRGRVVDDSVDWELRVTALANDPPLDDALWCEGTTRREGNEGRWTFHDAETAGNPAAGELTWGTDADGDFLILACLSGDDAGDRLTWRRDTSDCSLVFHATGSAEDWDVRWNERDGTGSLRVPDYNGGLRACWDERQNDTVCPE